MPIQENELKMHKLIIFVCLIELAGFTTTMAEEVKETKSSTSESEIIPSITTLSGKIYEECVVKEVTPVGIKIYHTKGIAKIPFSDLSGRYKRRYNYDPEKERVYIQALNEQESYLKSQKEIQEWQRNIKDFGRGSSTATEIGVGQVGTIGGKIKILQVVDKENFLAEIPLHVVKTRDSGTSSSDRGSATLALVGSAEHYKSVFAKTGKIATIDYELVWFTGISTENIVDEQSINISGIYEVSGTKTYETSDAGSKTVFVLKSATPPGIAR